MNKYLSLVKFSHTIFALPFALIGLTLGFREVAKMKTTAFVLWGPTSYFDYQKLAYVLICMVTARSAAMAFNRWADAKFDALNDRTAIREIPAGKISSQSALIFTFLNCIGFMASAYAINKLCFYLSPVALAVILGYSYTKRFTALCHIVLGLGLALAPIGAYLAVTEKFELSIIMLGFAVLSWVSGFDIIYSLQDEQFDRSQNLNSIPVMVGKKTALIVSSFLHTLSVIALAFFGWMEKTGHFFVIGWALFTLLIIYQHRLVKPNDLSRVNLAFFTTNGVGSVIFGVMAILDLAYYPYVH